jgi:hypothetical protein
MLTFNYVTYADIRTLPEMDDQTIIGIKAPPGTRLEVPDPDEVTRLKKYDYEFILIVPRRKWLTVVAASKSS